MTLESSMKAARLSLVKGRYAKIILKPRDNVEKALREETRSPPDDEIDTSVIVEGDEPNSAGGGEIYTPPKTYSYHFG